VDGSTSPVEFDVTKDVAAFTAGTAANYGWVIKDDGFNSGVATEYYSRESSTGKPVLIVESTDAPPSELAILTFPEPGTVLVDSSTGKEIVDVPLHGRTFSNLADAVNWTASTFNATVQRDASGAPIGVTGESVQIGDLFYVDSAGNMIEINDIVPTLLGGQDGIVTIAGTQYCARPEICGEAFKSAQDYDNKCSSSGSFCANQESWWVKPAQRLWIYASSGGKLAQGTGGWHQKCSFCWRTPSPWLLIPTRVRCCKGSGTNSLTLRNTYVAHEDCGPIGCNTYQTVFEQTGHNTSSVKQRLYAVFQGKIGWKNGNVSVSGAPASGAIDGVCSRGNASGTGGSYYGIVTGDGKTLDSFCDQPDSDPVY
jgi:hypothetical protein